MSEDVLGEAIAKLCIELRLLRECLALDRAERHHAEYLRICAAVEKKGVVAEIMESWPESPPRDK